MCFDTVGVSDDVGVGTGVRESRTLDAVGVLAESVREPPDGVLVAALLLLDGVRAD